MNFSNEECHVAEEAIKLIFNRKRIVERYASNRPEGFTSVLIELSRLKHEDIDIDGYTKSQLINAITRPWAAIFFLSHMANEPDVVEKLASYIEKNTYLIPAWYVV